MQRSTRQAGLAALLVALLGTPRTAEACHTGTSIGIVLFGLVEGINAPLTIHDLVVDESSRGYGLTETLLWSSDRRATGPLHVHHV